MQTARTGSGLQQSPHSSWFPLVWCESHSLVCSDSVQNPRTPSSVTTKITPRLWLPTSPYLNLCNCHLWQMKDTGLMRNHILCTKLKITILTENANISRHELYHALRNICRYRACSKVAGWHFEFSQRNKVSWNALKKKWTLESLDMCSLPALTAMLRDIICGTRCSTYWSTNPLCLTVLPAYEYLSMSKI